MDRLVKEALCPFGKRALFVFRRVAAADHDDGNIFGFFKPSQPIYNEKPIPGHPAPMGHIGWEADVQKNQVGSFFARDAYGCAAVLSRNHSITRSLEFEGEGFDNDGVV